MVEENEINWENYTGLCTDGAQSMSGRNAGLETRCMLHREVRRSRNVRVFLAVVRVVKCAKTSPLKDSLLS
jgi:hypothetical protein